MEIREKTGQVKIASGLNLLLGIWLIVASFLLGYSAITAAMWNDIIVGAIILILAGIRVARPAQNTWLSWINAALGVWLVIAPFLLGYSAVAAARWNDIIVGVGVIILAVWSALTMRQDVV